MGSPNVRVELAGDWNNPIQVYPIHVAIDAPLPKVTVGLDQIDVAIKALPKINVGLDQIDVAIKELPKINIGLDPIRIALEPLRCHLPVDMSVCFNLFGHDLASIRFCGEAQFVAEPYVPNPCECAPPKDGHGPA